MITKKSFWKMWNKVKKCICTQKNSALIYSIYEQQSAVSDSCSFLINLLLVSSTSCCFYTSSYRILWIMWRYFQEFCNTEYCKWSANKKQAQSLSKVVSILTSTAWLRLASQRAQVQVHKDWNLASDVNKKKLFVKIIIMSHLCNNYSYEKFSLQQKFRKLWTYTHNHHHIQVFLCCFFFLYNSCNF